MYPSATMIPVQMRPRGAVSAAKIRGYLFMLNVGGTAVKAEGLVQPLI